MDARSVDALTTALGARSGRVEPGSRVWDAEEARSTATASSKTASAPAAVAVVRAAAHDGNGPFSARLSTTLISPTLTASESSSSAERGAPGVSGSASDITGAYPSSVGSRSSGASETVAVPSRTSAAYASLCHTSAATLGPAASAVAKDMTPAPKSTCPSPFCKITSDARATAAGGLVRTGVAAAARGFPPSDTASSSSGGRDSLTTTDAVGKGSRRVDLKLRTSAVSVNRWVVSLICGSFFPTFGSKTSEASADVVAGGGADARLASTLASLSTAFALASYEYPVSGASLSASGAWPFSCVERVSSLALCFRALGITSLSVAKTRTSGDDAPLSAENVAEESLSHDPACSPPGAYSSAFCFIARMSTTAQPRRRWSSETARGKPRSAGGATRSGTRARRSGTGAAHLNERERVSAGARTRELELRALRLQPFNLAGAALPRERRTAPHRGGGQAREARAVLLVIEHAIHLERGVRREMATLVHEHLELEHGCAHLGSRRHGEEALQT
jgi:hypothetical protein